MSINPRPNGTQACAACRYQRRKCTPDCILAPYFPHDRQRQFLNAHKLFGVSNITKIIRNLPQPDKDEAMRTIIFQSDVRATDPVGGCYRVIRELQRQIEFSRAELEIVLQHLAIFRAQNQAQILMTDGTDSNNNVDPLSSFDPMHYPHHLQPHQEQYVLQSENEQVVPLQEINSWAVHESTPASLQIKQPSVNGCDDIKPLLDIPAEERHEFKFELEETKECSDEVIFKEDKAILEEENDSIQHTQDHDLKSAATFFSLTNCNSY